MKNLAKGPLSKPLAAALKRSLVSARTLLADAVSIAEQAGDTRLAARLHEIGQPVMDEIERLDSELAKQRSRQPSPKFLQTLF